MKNKILYIILVVFTIVICITGCNDTKTIGVAGKWETTYIVYYYRHNEQITIYTDEEVYTCSFNGTNYLIEKDNPEELLSTTAQIRIIDSHKVSEENN